ncbi:MAG: hypothetical protein ACLFUS_01235 [Candidatus Sumerlaeia bacterium]
MRAEKHHNKLINALSLILMLAFCLQGIAPHAKDLDLDQEAKYLWDSAVVALFPTGYREKSELERDTKRSVNPQAGIMDSDRDPADVILRRTYALLEDISTRHPKIDFSDERSELDTLAQKVKASAPRWENAKIKRPWGTNAQGNMTVNDWIEVDGQVVANEGERFPLYRDIYMIQRRIAFKNPLLDFDKILFIKKHPAVLSHMVDQYFGYVQRPGGSLCILENAFSDSPTVKDLLADALCENGRLKGQPLEPGSFMSPDLSYDGKTIYFAYTETREFFGKGVAEANDGKLSFRKKEMPYEWDETTSFHIFKINADGSGLTMLTDGPVNDFDPCVLPNGRIAFVSERRGGEGRCHPRPCPTYVLHSMLPDGSDIVPLSYHETNEWHPSVNNEGEIVYARWDYVDRQVGGGQYPWVTKPDGRDARALWGNYDEARIGGAQFEPMAIPNSTKYVATICGHHSQAYGPIAVHDSSIPELVDEEKCVVHLTPEQSSRLTPSAFTSPWPLDEHYFLVAYSPESRKLSGAGYKMIPYEQPVNHGIYLLDCFGNRILLYRDSEIGSQNPIPFKARTTPTIIPHQTAYAFPPDMQDQKADSEAPSIISVMDVYQSLKPWPENRKISSLRIVQLYPKPTPFQDNPRIGYAQMMNARASLGTVPVEADGSAHFIMPSKIPVYFQALDENGLAIQTMMSDIYTHPGESLTCVGCHEPPSRTLPERKAMPLALKREPSKIQPDVTEGKPMLFAHWVQPVLDAKCVECHQKNPKSPQFSKDRVKRRSWNQAYESLHPYVWYISGRERGDDNPHAFRSRSTPGEVGAYVSPLYKMLTTGSHKDKVKLTVEEMQRITVWIDLSAPYLGAYRDTRDQTDGNLVIPNLY